MKARQTRKKTGGKVPSPNSRKSNQGSPENESKELGPQSALLLFLPVQCPFLLLTAPVSFRVSPSSPGFSFGGTVIIAAPPFPGQSSGASPTPSPRTFSNIASSWKPSLHWGQLPLFCAPRLPAVRTLVCPRSQPCTVPGTWYSRHVS